jgi:hypothetical protein
MNARSGSRTPRKYSALFKLNTWEQNQRDVTLTSGGALFGQVDASSFQIRNARANDFRD